MEDFIYGLDEKTNIIINYCKYFLDNDKEFSAVRKKLSIIPTFLFYGLPGTGKSTIARKVYRQLKEEHNIDFFQLKFEEIISFNLGESSKNLISYFDKMKKKIKANDASAFVVIDEIDSFTVNRHRSDNDGIKRLLITFNTIIDDMFFNGELDNIILVATTNLMESIDTSVLRRFFFHEDFNILLNKNDFMSFSKNIVTGLECFTLIQDEEFNKLFDIYVKKKFTLGEMKNIFAHFYMVSTVGNKNRYKSLTEFAEQESFFEIISEQIK